MNNWNFTGNLGKDAEVKFTAAGKAVCEFSVAVKSGYGDRAKTNWVRCAMFGKKAEGNLPSYLTKGTQVAVSGELELQEWDGQNGKGSALAVSVANIDLIGGTDRNQAPQQAPRQAPQQHAPQGYGNPPQSGYTPQQEAPQHRQAPQPQYSAPF